MASSSDLVRVLWVQEEQDALSTAIDRLGRENDRLTVTIAPDATTALDRLSDERFDCVVSGPRLADSDGLAFLDAVRAEFDAVPLVLCVGDPDSPIATEAISRGATAVVGPEADDADAILADAIERAVGHDPRVVGEETLDAVIEASPDAIVVVDDAGTVELWNRAAEEMFGWSAEEVLGRPNPIVPDERDEEFDRIRGTVFDGERSSFETRRRTRAGELLDVSLSTAPVRDDDGEITGAMAIIEDITHRKARERQLATLHDATRRLMTADTPEAVAAVAVEAARDVLGYDLNAIHLYDSDAAGLAPAAATDAAQDFVGDVPTFREGESIAWRVFESGEPTVVDDVRTDPDVSNSDTPVRSEMCLPLGKHGVFLASAPDPGVFDDSDLALGKVLAANTEAALDQVENEQALRRREAELERQNERLEEFASVLSHDLRNPLNVAMGRLELVREERDDDQLAAIADAHARMERLIEGVLTWAREGLTVTDRDSVALGDVTRECWLGVSSPEATLDVAGDVTVEADRDRLQRLLENLLRNAVEHGGPSVTVTVGPLSDDAGFYVADDGPGIPEADRETVFEAGYTDSEDGTGLGLNIVAEIVESHGWAVSVGESEGGGARFEVRVD